MWLSIVLCSLKDIVALYPNAVDCWPNMYSAIVGLNMSSVNDWQTLSSEEMLLIARCLGFLFLCIQQAEIFDGSLFLVTLQKLLRPGFFFVPTNCTIRSTTCENFRPRIKLRPFHLPGLQGKCFTKSVNTFVTWQTKCNYPTFTKTESKFIVSMNMCHKSVAYLYDWNYITVRYELQLQYKNQTKITDLNRPTVSSCLQKRRQS